MAEVRPEDGRMSVKVFSPYQTFYQGAAVSLSAYNREGPFDVLYNHGHFFSLLSSGKVTVRTDYGTNEIEIENGILKVSDNLVTLFVNV